MFDITTERPEDGAAIEALLDAAFDPRRHAKVSYRYRDGVSPTPSLRLTARLRQRLVGTVRCWPIFVGEDDVAALLLGPLAVDAAHRDLGIGTALVRRLLDLAASQGHRLVFLVGDLDYYRRFGFRSAAAHGFVMPGERPERLSMIELAPGALAAASGILKPWRGLRAGRVPRRSIVDSAELTGTASSSSRWRRRLATADSVIVASHGSTGARSERQERSDVRGSPDAVEGGA